MSKQCLEYGEKVTVTGRVTGQVADTTDDILKFNVEFGADSACVPYSLINQPDEPQKVVIPRFVAEWLEYCKRGDLSILFALSIDSLINQEVFNWIKYKECQEVFIRAWVVGYEVEQEKLYTVEIPNPNNADIFFQGRHADKGKIFIDYICHADEEFLDWKLDKMYQLTESEIKQDFEWAWQFAEEVE